MSSSAASAAGCASTCAAMPAHHAALRLGRRARFGRAGRRRRPVHRLRAEVRRRHQGADAVHDELPRPGPQRARDLPRRRHAAPLRRLRTHRRVAARRSHGPIDEALAEQGLSRHVALITPTFYAAIFALADSDLILPAMPGTCCPASSAWAWTCAPSTPIDMPAVTVVQAWPPRLDSDPAHRWLRQTIKQVCSDASEAADAAP